MRGHTSVDSGAFFASIILGCHRSVHSFVFGGGMSHTFMGSQKHPPLGINIEHSLTLSFRDTPMQII